MSKVVVDRHAKAQIEALVAKGFQAQRDQTLELFYGNDGKTYVRKVIIIDSDSDEEPAYKRKAKSSVVKTAVAMLRMLSLNNQ